MRCLRLTAVLLPLAAILSPLSPAAAEDYAQRYAPGEKLTILNCGRCHVVSPKNRMGGIGSTPSFAVLRTIADWEDRMRAFWTLRPHPSFTQIEGVTDPFPEDRPAHIHPVTLTLKEVERIVAYARTIPPADLGADLGLR
jgi:hypothetical protein